MRFAHSSIGTREFGKLRPRVDPFRKVPTSCSIPSIVFSWSLVEETCNLMFDGFHRV